MDPISYMLITVGLFLIIAEMVIPGGVVAPLGVGALIVFGLRYYSIVADPAYLMLTWIGSSISFVIVGRVIIDKYFPGDAIEEDVNECLDHYGKIVEVLETIQPGESIGRIRYQGTAWKAISGSNLIKNGQKAKIIDYEKDSASWVVEPLTDGEIDRLLIEE